MGEFALVSGASEIKREGRREKRVGGGKSWVSRCGGLINTPTMSLNNPYIGVGFDTKGAASLHVRRSAQVLGQGVMPFRVPDSREGWVESLRLLLSAYLRTSPAALPPAPAPAPPAPAAPAPAPPPPAPPAPAGAAGAPLEEEPLPPMPICFDYSSIRPAGTPIKGFGGTASGPACLVDLHEAIHETLHRMVSALDGGGGVQGRDGM